MILIHGSSLICKSLCAVHTSVPLYLYSSVSSSQILPLLFIFSCNKKGYTQKAVFGYQNILFFFYYCCYYLVYISLQAISKTYCWSWISVYCIKFYTHLYLLSPSLSTYNQMGQKFLLYYYFTCCCKSQRIDT